MGASREPLPFHSQQITIYMYILGRIRLQVGDAVITDESARSLKLWSVLCYFILHRDRAVSQAELIDLFWPEEDRREPLSALKMMILRIRKLLSSLIKEDVNPILNRRGAYQWNPDIFCEVDAEHFEALCAQASQPTAPPQWRMALYQEAVALYKGELLPKQSDQQWVIPLSSKYSSRYISAVKEYAGLLQEAGLYVEMGDICLHACKWNPLDEQLHILIVRSFLLQKKHTDALRHYTQATKSLYQNLGLRPSPEMQALYMEITEEERGCEDDLEVILAEMKSMPRTPGAFFCEYGLFSAIYQLEARRIMRGGGCLHIALLTLSLPDNTQIKVLNTIMDQLQKLIVLGLRQSDVVSRYSKTQFLIMLPYASLEDSAMVMDRIAKAFYSKYQKSLFTVTYALRELEPDDDTAL